MNLLQQTQQLCKLYDIKPARSKGQNFLINEEVYDQIIKAADLKKDDVVLEVGPGLGFLTFKLAERVKKVIAVELDDKLAEILRVELNAKGIKNVEIVNEDILSPSAPSAVATLGADGDFKIVTNLPYNITSIFLRKVLSAEVKPSLMVLMLQKEVAERICAKQGKMNLLAVSVQFYAKPEIIEIVPADSFWPQPKVDSAIIKINIKNVAETHYLVETHCNASLRYNEKNFFRLLKIGFSAKRKMLKNNLSAGYHISQQEAEEKIVKAGFDPKIRAQELSVADWVKLLEEFKGDVV